MGPFLAEVGTNVDDSRAGGYYIEYWIYDPNDPFFPEWCEMDEYLPVNQESGAPSSLEVSDSLIEIGPSNPEVEVWFYVDVEDIYVEMRYRYNDGPEQTTPEYNAQGGAFSVTCRWPEHAEAAGRYVYTGIRNSHGGTWHSVNAEVILQVLPDGSLAVTVPPGANSLIRSISRPREWRASGRWDSRGISLIPLNR